jgi:hypothetical protein
MANFWVVIATHDVARSTELPVAVGTFWLSTRLSIPLVRANLFFTCHLHVSLRLAHKASVTLGYL